MAKTFQMTPMLRISNTLMGTLVQLGVPVGLMHQLTVPGRKSGQPRTTTIAVIQHEGGRYILAPYGVVDWVRNLRAAGKATLTRSRKTETVIATELPPKEAALILKATTNAGPSFLRAYYDTNANSTLAEFEQEALRHPVFQIHPA